jgi:hypothetical protein
MNDQPTASRGGAHWLWLLVCVKLVLLVLLLDATNTVVLYQNY